MQASAASQAHDMSQAKADSNASRMHTCFGSISTGRRTKSEYNGKYVEKVFSIVVRLSPPFREYI